MFEISSLSGDEIGNIRLYYSEYALDLPWILRMEFGHFYPLSRKRERVNFDNKSVYLPIFMLF